MSEFRKAILEELKRFEHAMKESEEFLSTAPLGTLRISASGGCKQFYYVKSENGEKKYISKSDGQFVAQLAQKAYDQKVLRIAKRRYGQLQKLAEEYKDDEIEQVYLNEHLERRKRIEPIEKPWGELLKEWMSVPYNGKTFAEGSPLILTEKGERVRSKSEKILADYFLRNNIAYKYECPLELKGYGIVYPDFTLLSSKTKREIYLEHMGRMDDSEYAEKAVRKIKLYERNGIFPGERLLLTFETAEMVLDMRLLKEMIERVI